ncbi:MAG TPA: KTSC domain-containing protein [Anaerolineaceae bacterium]
MERQPITSSSLRSVGYDQETKTLEIEFQTGKVYTYSEVPRKIYDDLMKAESRGQYFNHNIRDQFSGRRLSAKERSPKRRS